MSNTTPDVHRLLRLASLQWHGAQTALLDLFALRPPEGDPRMPGYEMVLDFLMSNAPCGNGPLDRAIARELGEASPYWYAHGAKPPEPDETAVLVAQLRARIEELERLPDAPKAYPDRVCLDDAGLVDDVFFSGADVHIERMRHRGWWAGIYTAAGEVVHLDWYLEDVKGKKKKGLHLRVEGGPKPTKPKEKE